MCWPSGGPEAAICRGVRGLLVQGEGERVSQSGEQIHAGEHVVVGVLVAKAYRAHPAAVPQNRSGEANLATLRMSDGGFDEFGHLLFALKFGLSAWWQQDSLDDDRRAHNLVGPADLGKRFVDLFVPGGPFLLNGDQFVGVAMGGIELHRGRQSGFAFDQFRHAGQRKQSNRLVPAVGVDVRFKLQNGGGEWMQGKLFGVHALILPDQGMPRT